MKQKLIAILIAVLLVGATSAVAFASGPAWGAGRGQGCTGANCNQEFIDADGDGICDNWQQGGRGGHRGRGQEFVDTDRDGVCDNWQQGGRGGHRGCGQGFVDADGDGVCDHHSAN